MVRKQALDQLERYNQSDNWNKTGVTIYSGWKMTGLSVSSNSEIEEREYQNDF